MTDGVRGSGEVIPYGNSKLPSPERDVERRLAAVLAADVEGYSRLMGADEDGTLETLHKCRHVIDQLIAKCHGHFVGSSGDSVLAEFASAVDAMKCAFEIQRELWVINADLPMHRRMLFRIGLNLGDIIIDKKDIFGDGVNVASRLEGLADGGGITVSRSLYDQVKNKVDFTFDSIGTHRVKNISEPVEVYRVRMTPDDLPTHQMSTTKKSVLLGVISGFFALLLLQIGGYAIWTHFIDSSDHVNANGTIQKDLSKEQKARLKVTALPLKHGPGTTFQQCADCPSMVVVPSGSFTMGSPEDEIGRHPKEIEGPTHLVTVPRAFAVGQFEITFREWDACYAAGGCAQNPQDRGWGRGNRPVMYVSWFDIQQYLQWISNVTGQDYRLLTESEWEFVARAGSSSAYWWGNKVGVDKANCLGCGENFNGAMTVPTGSMVQNPFGLYDVHGNVYEWVQDCWNGSYAGAPNDGSAWINGDCSLRVLRGGAWGKEPINIRSARRIKSPPTLRSGKRGFRVAMTLPLK
ncbi:MAG: SUMF1/EgtB/PvdO family nonheme iron enzyme [Rhodospirillales bacterium]|nr:SUMF1/EgtB/PvdO family nonheme iron enzyme [Rhodospirillales bacterium]